MIIIEELYTDHAHKRLVKVKCDCGILFICRKNSVLTGNTKSCGCWKRIVDRQVTHGHGRRGLETITHRSYRAMKARCYNPHNDRYYAYGKRGIKVCDRWRESFTNFLLDMGERPSLKHTIDRINVDGHYSPSNCRWALQGLQAMNKRKPGAMK